MNKLLFIFSTLSLLSISTLSATISPDKIEKELSSAETKFYEASQVFNPWYTGPLLTASAHVIPKGQGNVQPYLFVTDVYGSFTSNRNTVSSTNDTVVVNPLFVIQFGIYNRWDFTITAQGYYNHELDQNSFHAGDTSLTLGFGILNEGLYAPAIKFTLKETFPSGNYEDLYDSRLGTDNTGMGSYITSLGLNVSKVLWWFVAHPMNLRLSLSYSFPSKVHVHGLNAYGGGNNTSGTVTPGQIFASSFGYELSLTQKWVFALDALYTFSYSSHFNGVAGITSSGEAATVGSSISDQFSLAPAIEYNVSSRGGFIVGVWFPVTGRNSPNFISGVLSYTYAF